MVFTSNQLQDVFDSQTHTNVRAVRHDHGNVYSVYVNDTHMSDLAEIHNTHLDITLNEIVPIDHERLVVVVDCNDTD